MQKTIVGFGASSMEGIGDETGGGFFKRIQPAFNQHRFINLGIGGNTTRDMLQRCDQVVSYRPYDLIVLPGCNDFPRANDEDSQARTSVEEYCQNLTRILTTIKGKRSIFITSFPVDPIRSGVSAEMFDRYISRAHAIAVNSGYEIIDLYAMIRTSRREYLSSDGIHFNAQGHQAIADLLKSALLHTMSDP